MYCIVAMRTTKAKKAGWAEHWQSGPRHVRGIGTFFDQQSTNTIALLALVSVFQSVLFFYWF